MTRMHIGPISAGTYARRETGATSSNSVTGWLSYTRDEMARGDRLFGQIEAIYVLPSRMLSLLFDISIFHSWHARIDCRPCGGGARSLEWIIPALMLRPLLTDPEGL